MVKAIVLSDESTIVVQCDFISGTDAQGCVVVIVGDVDNFTVTVARNDSMFAVGSIVVPSHRTMSRYVDVLGYDVEADGSVGTEGVPGKMYHVNIAVNNSKFTRYRQYYGQHKINASHYVCTGSKEDRIAQGTLATLAGLFLVIIVILIITIICQKHNRKCTAFPNICK